MSASADPLKSADEVPTDERTPLLGVSDAAGAKAFVKAPGLTTNGDTTSIDPQHVHEEPEDDKPMPYAQVVLLCFAGIIEPVTYFAIFPIIPDMISRTGNMDQTSVSIWSGLIESLFSVVQMSVMIPYGKLSDRIGRRPILVFSLFGIVGSSAVFGMSQTLWQMILLRSVAGLFAGSNVTIRAMLSEITTKKQQAVAFSWYMFTRNLGIFVGPLIGGPLASPNKNLGLDVPFFDQFPFALSMFGSAAFCLVAALTTLFFVNETLASKLKGGEVAPKEPMTIRELVKSPGVGVVLYLYTHVGMLALMYTAVFESQKIVNGGFAWQPPQIGVFVALAGASQAAWMLLVFPALHRRLGTGWILRACTYAWPFFFVINPLFNEFLRVGWTKPFWIGMPIVTIIGSGVAMAFTCVQLALNDIAPSANTLGTLNALALTLSSGTRAIAPILGTAIHQLGVKTGWIHGHLIWVVLVVLALGLIVGARYLPAAAQGRPAVKSNESRS